MPVAREREASPAAEERNNKKQKVDSLGLPAGPAIHLPDPAGLADQYKENRPYRHLSVGGLFDDAVVSGRLLSPIEPSNAHFVTNEP